MSQAVFSPFLLNLTKECLSVYLKVKGVRHVGELADDMVDGFSCSWCGIYFKRPHEYPVVCKSCAKGYSDKKLLEMGVQRAIEKEMG